METTISNIALTVVVFLMMATVGTAAPATGPATQRGADNGWDPSYFKYERPRNLAVEQSTPTAAQTDWTRRPPQMPANIADPAASDRPAKPATVASMEIVHLRFKDADGENVPALLCTPKGRKGPFPLVIAVHGLGSNKAQVCAQVGPSLTGRGFAVLAPDMPSHGERPGNPLELWSKREPLKAFETFRQCVIDVRQCIDLAENLPGLDLSHGVILAGYSMGSFIDSVTGPADGRVKAMVLMVGGAQEIAGAALIPQVNAVDPASAIPHFAPRPVLMLNAKRDVLIAPAMAERLFSAAAEPKQQLWYDSGHLLPSKAYDDAAEWTAQMWKKLTR